MQTNYKKLNITMKSKNKFAKTKKLLQQFYNFEICLEQKTAIVWFALKHALVRVIISAYVFLIWLKLSTILFLPAIGFLEKPY